MPPAAPPYLYGATQRYSPVHEQNVFKTKPYTRASFAPSTSSLPKPQLLDFNQHPDSYLILPYGNTSQEPMSSKTRARVARARWTLLAIRCLQIIGAAGSMFFAIAIKGTTTNDSYTLKVPPAVDIATLFYAIYFLCRSARSRAPSSSSSYHSFAMVIDLGLIAMYVLIALLATSNDAKWSSRVGDASAIIKAAWIDAVALAGLHVLSFMISAYLVIMFYRISQLPPDLNPLEDNLTSRRKTKHKYKHSDLSTASTFVGSNDSRPNSGRVSPGKKMMEIDVRPVSFLHTRANSDGSYSPHNPSTANTSSTNLAIPTVPEIYQKPRSPLSRQPETLPQLPAGQLANASSHYWEKASPRQHHSHLPTMLSGSSRYSEIPEKSETPPLPRKSSKRRSLFSDNWFVYDFGRRAIAENKSPRVPVVDEEMDEEDFESNDKGYLETASRYQPVTQNRDAGLDDLDVADLGIGQSLKPKPAPGLRGFEFNPLGMNPPTPPASSQGHRFENTESVIRPFSTVTGNRSRSNSPAKQKYYGDLSAAMKGIRHAQRDSAIDMNPLPAGEYDQSNWSLEDGKSYKLDDQGRVVSRSGVEIENTSSRDHGRLRGRNVSGKIAEEGRGG